MVLLILCFLAANIFWWRIADRRVSLLPGSALWRSLLALFIGTMIVYLLMIVLWIAPLRRSHSPFPIPVHTLVYLWNFLALPATLMLMLGAQVGRALRKVGRSAATLLRAKASPALSAPIPEPTRQESPALNAIRQGSNFPNPPQGLTRRQMLSAAAVAFPPLLTGGVTVAAVRSLYGRRLQSYILPIPRLPRALEGMTIAHVSDTHIGKFLHPDRLPAIADDINKLDADFIVFTGDLIDLALDDLPFGIDFLHRLKSRCGMAICEGNHDLMQDRGAFEERMLSAGLPIMVGEQRIATYTSHDGQSHPIQFLGTPWNGRDDQMNDAVNFLAPALRPDAFPILLAHHPHSFDAATRFEIPLTLSGHTHGGQIMLNPHFGVGSALPIHFWALPENQRHQPIVLFHIGGQQWSRQLVPPPDKRSCGNRAYHIAGQCVEITIGVMLHGGTSPFILWPLTTLSLPISMQVAIKRRKMNAKTPRTQR